eukprot:10234123-Alexandrium_andersonii.AAC.1
MLWAKVRQQGGWSAGSWSHGCSESAYSTAQCLVGCGHAQAPGHLRGGGPATPWGISAIRRRPVERL